MSCRVVTESLASREKRVLNRLRDLRDLSRYVTGWRELLPRGETLGLDGALPVDGMASKPWFG